MAVYHVGINRENGSILGGTKTKTGKWQNNSDVTEEALAAVRDHLLYKTIKENKSIYYGWQYPNGKTILLKLEETETENIHDENGQDPEPA